VQRLCIFGFYRIGFIYFIFWVVQLVLCTRDSALGQVNNNCELFNDEIETRVVPTSTSAYSTSAPTSASTPPSTCAPASTSTFAPASTSTSALISVVD
jgi:hypothetical protein